MSATTRATSTVVKVSHCAATASHRLILWHPTRASWPVLFLTPRRRGLLAAGTTLATRDAGFVGYAAVDRATGGGIGSGESLLGKKIGLKQRARVLKPKPGQHFGAQSKDFLRHVAPSSSRQRRGTGTRSFHLSRQASFSLSCPGLTLKGGPRMKLIYLAHAARH